MKRSLWLGLAFCLFASCGATCWPRSGAGPAPPPVVFAAPPSLQDILIAINTNTQPVRELQAENATLRVQGLPALKANLALQRPRRFRMRAELFQFTGAEMDLGSNDELFWMWVRRNPQRAVYFARHQNYAQSPLRQLLPIEPHWFIEALGLVEMDPAGNHEGPYSSGEHRVWIRTRLPSPQGDMTRILVVHDTYGWVLEQHLYDARGALLASARASQHKHYAEAGVTLPQRLDVQLAPGQPSQMQFQLDVGDYLINQLVGEPDRLWQMPRFEGTTTVDVADPRWQRQILPNGPPPTGPMQPQPVQTRPMQPQPLPAAVGLRPR